MDNSLLNQILHEYELKRTKAITEANNRKKEILQVNPHLAELEKEIAYSTIQASKAILISNNEERTKLLAELNKKTKSLIKEKNSFLKTLSKDSRIS